MNPPRSPLLAQWTTLYTKTLPSLALSKSPAQATWSVHLDHCFARIIYDGVIGIDTPWTSKLKSPAVKHMSEEQLRKCIEMGEGIAEGSVDLKEWDERSLRVRGKAKGGKRKRDVEAREGENEEDLRKIGGEVEVGSKKPKSTPKKQPDIRSSFFPIKPPSGPTQVPLLLPSPPSSPSPTSPTNSPQNSSLKDPLPSPHTLLHNSSLAPFRRSTLLSLLQVPRGHYTTYGAIANFLSSSPRAVGNAMRNNPFAPTVPCHRVLASDGSIGGFGGEWGEGEKVKEKVRLLRAEGVRFDGRGRVVGAVWRGFV